MVVGRASKTDNVIKEPAHQYPIGVIKKHERFQKGGRKANNIVLIRVSGGPIKWNDHVQPIEISPEDVPLNTQLEQWNWHYARVLLFFESFTAQLVN